MEKPGAAYGTSTNVVWPYRNIGRRRMVSIKCSACNHRFAVPQEYVGRQIRCPNCQHKQEAVPAGAMAERRDRERRDRDRELRATMASAADNILLTTETCPPFPVSDRIGVLVTQCAYGMNIFRDLFAEVRDVVGGRSESTQAILNDASNTALRELRLKAVDAEADGVIGVSLNHSEFSGKNKSMLFVVAVGTAVRFKNGSREQG